MIPFLLISLRSDKSVLVYFFVYYKLGFNFKCTTNVHGAPNSLETALPIPKHRLEDYSPTLASDL